jgi:hypothetical protein
MIITRRKSYNEMRQALVNSLKPKSIPAYCYSVLTRLLAAPTSPPFEYRCEIEGSAVLRHDGKIT